MKEDAVIIIASRLESRRLPGKVFRLVAGIPSIEHILHRLNGFDRQIILAVPDHCRDYDYLVPKFNESLNISIYNGQSDSPLHRLYQAYLSHSRKQKYVIRITHDDILVDQPTMFTLLEKMKTDRAGYGISPDIIDGAGVEIFDIDNLKYAIENRKDPTEYVSYFVKYKPNGKIIKHEPRWSIKKPYRLTMDYYQDWLVLDTVLRKLGPFASNDEICEFLDQHYSILGWNKQPDITVYTCAYNAERWISEAIQSVLNQNHDNFEYIVIDDGSIDDTALIVSKFSSDKRLKFFRNDINQGLASCSNQALSLAKGEYVMRLDADDSLKAGALNRMQRLIRDSHAGVLYSAYNTIDEKGIPLDLNCDPKIHHHAGCALMDKRLINELRFSDGLRHYDSMELFNRIKERFEIAYNFEAYWYYRKHPNSLSSKKTKERDETFKRINS